VPIEALRTPENRFETLPDFPYTPHYADNLPGYEGLRAAYVDEGPADADHVFLCLHGEPTWSFLYRRMIPVFLAAGGRVVAPDFFGFGRSDKPVKLEDYSFHFHRNHLIRLIERLNLHAITLVVQDWGGLLGLTLPIEPGMRGRIDRLLVMNTALAVGESPSDGFLAWRTYAEANPDLPVGALIQRSAPHLTAAEAAAYDAPFPDMAYKSGVRAFPRLVMTEPGMAGIQESRAARAFWANDWRGRSFMAYGAADPVLGPPVMQALWARLRDCPEPMVIPEAGHFVQEWGEPIARAALAAWTMP
jgi:haloalkane dehalogenase